MEENSLRPRDTRLNVAIVGNYIPRKCGIATFTSDVAGWVSRDLGPDSDVFVVAMNDRQEGYDYPPMVRFEVLASNPRDYHRAADFINLSGVDIVCLQHEFGIFGGSMGIYITDLLRDLAKPVVTTVHTVLPDPTPERRETLVEVADLSDALIVMSQKSIEFLERYYGIPPDKIYLIHHGVPDQPFTDPDGHKAAWGLQGKTVLLTFGLIAAKKGLEYMIEAMPRVVERFPDAVYVILGATHPPAKKKEGEKYRFYLKRRVHDLGMEDHVLFYERFVTLEELTEFLASADIYVTPYLEEGQIVSGTLAYAMGLGKPIVSTPYYYAQELLADGRGVLADFRDSESLASAVTGLLEDPGRLRGMREKAYEFGRSMTWPKVAGEYVKLFRTVIAGRELAPATAHRQPMSFRDLPRPKLDHLVRLTDSTGIIHRAHFDIPDKASGYTTDDNALALAVAVLCHLQTDDPGGLELARTYLGFLRYMQLPDGRFHNLLNYDLTFADEVGSEECQGRALAGLGLTLALEPSEGLASFAKAMFDDALPAMDLSYPRAIANAICGCYHYLTRFPGASLVVDSIERLAEKLLAAYQRESASEWNWFERSLTYANGLLPRAMLLAYRATRIGRYREAGLESLEFLTGVCYRDGFFELVGDQGWYTRGGNMARFRQLPIEAASLVEAYIDALVLERDERYLGLARSAFEWFLGRNDLEMPLYDFASGSCADGILLREVDSNRGAEATVSFLLALLRMTNAVHVEGSGDERAAVTGA